MKPAEIVEQQDQIAELYKQLADYPQVIEAFEACMAADTFAFDLETTSFNPYTGRIMGFSVAVDTELVPSNCWYKCCDPAVMVPKSWYFQFVPEFKTGATNEEALKMGRGCVPMILTLKLFHHVLRDPKKKNVMQNGKFDMKFMSYYGYPVMNELIDTALAAWLLDENRGTNKLKDISQIFLKHQMIKFNELGGLFSPPIAEYGADDACQTLRLWRVFQPMLEEQRLMKVFIELECTIPRILADVENLGCAIDTEFLEDLRGEISAEQQIAEETCYELAGERFSVASPADLNRLFFKKLNWKPRGKLKRTVHGYTTNKDMLQRYEDKPLAAAILKVKELSKIESTFIDPILKAAYRIDGRVRSNFNQLAHPRGGGGTVTGRLSSSASEELGGPNLQTIPSRSKTGVRRSLLALTRSS